MLHDHFNAPAIEFAKFLMRLQLLFYTWCSHLLSMPRLFLWCISTSRSVTRGEKNRQRKKSKKKKKKEEQKRHHGPWLTRSNTVQNSGIVPQNLPPETNHRLWRELTSVTTFSTSLKIIAENQIQDGYEVYLQKKKKNQLGWLDKMKLKSL